MDHISSCTSEEGWVRLRSEHVAPGWQPQGLTILNKLYACSKLGIEREAKVTSKALVHTFGGQPFVKAHIWVMSKLQNDMMDGSSCTKLPPSY